MTRFRPCIDLHAGQVKQIVGGTLSDSSPSALRTNHTSTLPSSHFASLYKDNGLTGAHIIMLGPGNDDAATAACEAWPGELQVGGGVNDGNAGEWIRRGAGKVIITSFLFPNGRFSLDRLRSVIAVLDDDTSKLVVDLSCRRRVSSEGVVTWWVAMNKWQTITDMEVNEGTIKMLAPYTSEFLIHAADVEGLQSGLDEDLVRNLASWCSIPVTYAGGASTVKDLDRVRELSQGKVDLTIGSALDIFGGRGVTLEECVEWNRREERREKELAGK
ncbi:phosphoribosylformimino-5-aminoimidazole carboxamide ribotide isomerase [Eremomyces bilateralis CBS 781.70]|uniref:1-(5-phosphoribosyl)-5-[(5-phosphoribosylamino)methylideneamino] imidazole-4-carboxamide isomerase n=1 Tax=Eremomyces bilateralis CBS 781.70 TaxID=1392243 RepID=A0A6G1G5J6_9PEZI|nr:phosphoribosylformimino-5-aminoimidazole carboxamide ribotide isomerase [Eremomyces bilateralis CBS 781.70]KAF1813365.1 phosphoribosylformimino-5-aminoimidazole carboxamide ribotide isomerase [Eremomyces bilateralis CBS 781.70]